MRARLDIFAMTVVSVLLIATATARAQDDRERARELFDQGTTAFAEGRYTDAIRDLRASLERFESKGTAFNLAGAYRGAGRTTEAVDVFDRLLAGAYGAMSEEELGQTRALRAETQGELGHIRLTVERPPIAEVRIDGERVEDTVSGVGNYAVDAGAHVVQARAQGFEVSERRVRVQGGATRDLTLALDAIPELTLEPTTELYEEPWLWVVVGLLVLGAAGLTVGLVLGTQDAGLFMDDEFGVTATLTVRPR